MPTNRLPAHEFTGVVCRILGLKIVAPLLQRRESTISRWCARPDENNPGNWTHGCIWQVETLVEEAFISGGDRGVKWARDLVRRLCDITEMDCAAQEPVCPDQPTVQAECLQDYPALVAFHEAVQDPNVDAATRARLEEAVIREIHETSAKRREAE